MTDKPCQEGTGCVGPGTAVPVFHRKLNQCIALPSPYSNLASLTRVPSGNNTVQQVVPCTQYQDCSVGFCGGWDSHDHTIQDSSQSHIQNHPSSMLGTQQCSDVPCRRSIVCHIIYHTSSIIVMTPPVWCETGFLLPSSAR